METKERKMERKKLNELLNQYFDLSENEHELVDMNGDEKLEEFPLSENYGCGMSERELIWECIEMRKYIDRVRKQIKKLEIC
tara:strand:- start:113 stop:358 length:246 start_codon:yes stop_codon:yes gene_type:complete